MASTKQPAEDKIQPFAIMPVANYCVKSIVGSGYLPGRPKIAKNFRYEVEYFNTLNLPSKIHKYNGPIPVGFAGDVSQLQDCQNPRHFIFNPENMYCCRWCGHSFSKSSNKARHERKCTVNGAPGHECDMACKNPATGLKCPGRAVYTPDKANDKRKNNSRGNMLRKKQTSSN
uniref:C2H2-type domain-containing protein n=1 Tax=Tetranychus urticae TaxID=32264 RepID=T1JQB6_TETUR